MFDISDFTVTKFEAFKKVAKHFAVGKLLKFGEKSLKASDCFNKMARELSKENAPYTEQEKTAYHEAGHAVTGFALIPYEDIQVINIIKYGDISGYVDYIDAQKISKSREDLIKEIAVLYAGMLSEEIQFKKTFEGGSSDMEMIRELANHMVVDANMSSSRFLPNKHNLNSGWLSTLFTSETMSPETMNKIDAEVQNIITEARELSYKTLERYWNAVDALATELIDRGVLTGEEAYQCVISACPDLRNLDTGNDQYLLKF